jgi:hypothetical protein
MSLELALLIATTACSGLSVLGVGWIAWRLRLRLRGLAAGTTSSAWTVGSVELHETHQYTHNPGDGYFYCAVEGCNARKKLGG